MRGGCFENHCQRHGRPQTFSWGWGGGSGKFKKGPPMEIKVAIKKFPYGEKAPHMVKKAPHKEKNVAKKAPIIENSGQKASPIAKKIIGGGGGRGPLYSCHPPPLRAPMAKEYGIPPRTFRRHRDKKVERIAKKRRAEAASHLTSSPYKAILLAKPASPPSKKHTKETECELTEKSTKNTNYEENWPCFICGESSQQ